MQVEIINIMYAVLAKARNYMCHSSSFICLLGTDSNRGLTTGQDFFKHTLTWTMVSVILNSLFGEVLTCPHNCYESAVYDMLTSLFRNLIPKLGELGKICQINTIDITA